MHKAMMAMMALSVGAVPAGAQSLLPSETMSTLRLNALADAHPVLGSDGKVHLAYELVVTNPSNMFITIDRLEAIDPARNSVANLSGESLSMMTTRYAGGKNQFAPGQTGIIFMDVTYARGATLPPSLATRVSISRNSDANGQPGPYPSGAPIGPTASFTGAPVKIGPAARRIAAPLRGAGWVAVNGCCDAITSHRGAVIAVNGKQNVPERFAIDWIRIDKGRKMYLGNGKKVTDFPFYGVPIHAVADGTVVRTFDEVDEQIPLEPAKGLTPASIGGNMMVVDIGGGAYAFYAHLQRGSLKAKLGDKVTKGQVLGLLGNTGNTDAPHLHFHLMDGMSALNANGLPFVIDEFTSEGVLPSDQLDPMFDGKAVTIDPRRKGTHVDQLPLNNEVSDFGD